MLLLPLLCYDFKEMKRRSFYDFKLGFTVFKQIIQKGFVFFRSNIRSLFEQKTASLTSRKTTRTCSVYRQTSI